MDSALSILNTTVVVLGNTQTFVQSTKQVKKLHTKLQTEVTSTMSRLNNLQSIVRRIGHTDGNGSSHIAVPTSSQSSEAQYLLQLDDIKEELRKLQEAAEGVRTQLDSMKDTSKKTSRKRLIEIFRADKEMDKIKTLLVNIRSIQESASWLNQIIPT